MTNIHLLFDFIKKSSFVRNVLVVMSGTAMAQAIGLALAPIISRLFSPADFGVFGSFYAVFSVIAAGVTLDYSQAIMLPKEKGEAINLLAVSCASTVLIASCCLAVCLLAPDAIQDLIKVPSAWMLSLLVAAILVSGFNKVCQAWCVRVKEFKTTSASQVIRSMSVNGTKLGLGYAVGGPAVLICSVILGDLLASLNLARVVIRESKAQWMHISWERMRTLAKHYRDFPMYSASQNVINALSIGLPVILLTHFFGIAIAGSYAFGMRMLQSPMELVRGALRQVLFQKASETLHHGGSLASLFAKITSGLFALAILPSICVFVWGPQLFTWIFGAPWHIAGEFTSSLVLWLLVAFCNLPAVLFARLIRIQSTVFFYDLVSLGARLFTLVFGGVYLDAFQSITLFAIVGAVMNFILILLVGYALIQKE